MEQGGDVDREGFRELLKKRKLSDKNIEASVALAVRFESYLAVSNRASDAAAASDFCNLLLQEQQNSYDNFLSLLRYGWFTKNNDVYLTILELLDGAEVQPNLYKKVAELYGQAVRDEVFAGTGVSQLGVPSSEKPFDLFPALDRLIEKVGYEDVERLLSACLRDLPDEYFLGERKKYKKSSDIDDYLRTKHQEFLEELRACQREGRLFFSQEITDDVLHYVEEHPETEGGVRDGDLLYITKIPYNAKEYLVETDPILKRYYACHCPWVRESIKRGNLRMNPVFCNCSGGFHKKPWEVIFGQTLQVEVLESALKGDFRCRFVVHLPENLEVS
jgi:hypothetical protein